MSKPGSSTVGSLRANRPEKNSDGDSITSDDICDAAEALRSVEIEAARDNYDAEVDTAETVVWSADSNDLVIPVNLEELSIDELRAVAGMLQIPNYSQITDQEELLATIRTYAEPPRRTPK